MRPGKLVITSNQLGAAMLETARTEELPNGTILDSAGGLAYAELYRRARQE